MERFVRKWTVHRFTPRASKFSLWLFRSKGYCLRRAHAMHITMQVIDGASLYIRAASFENKVFSLSVLNAISDKMEIILAVRRTHKIILARRRFKL